MRLSTFAFSGLLLCLSIGCSLTSDAQQTAPPARPAPQAAPVPPPLNLPQGPTAIAVGIDPTQAELDTIQGYPDCKVNAEAGYHGGNCKIQIWRNVPISPPSTMKLPAGVHVYVELFNARQNESVAFTVVANQTGPHQVGATALPTIIPGLESITFASPIPSTNDAKEAVMKSLNLTEQQQITPASQQLADAIEMRQKDLADTTNDVLSKTQNASVGMNCLSNYEALIPVGSGYKCSQARMLDYPKFPTAMTTAFGLITTATSAPLPINDVSDLDTVVKNFYLTCLSYYPKMGRDTKDMAGPLRFVATPRNRTASSILRGTTLRGMPARSMNAPLPSSACTRRVRSSSINMPPCSEQSLIATVSHSIHNRRSARQVGDRPPTDLSGWRRIRLPPDP